MQANTVVGGMMTRQPVDIKTASERLGISVEAARKCLAKGSLLADKDKDNELMGGLGHLYQAIIEVKDQTISLLERELEMWREEARRKDHLLDTLTDRLPELELPPALGESSLTAREGVTQGTVHLKRERSFWRRLFGKGETVA
jgi:hypothetical protein